MPDIQDKLPAVHSIAEFHRVYFPTDEERVRLDSLNAGQRGRLAAHQAMSEMFGTEDRSEELIAEMTAGLGVEAALSHKPTVVCRFP